MPERFKKCIMIIKHQWSPIVKQSALDIHRKLLALMQTRDWGAAEEECRRLNAQYPSFAPGWYMASRIAAARNASEDALQAINRAFALDTSSLTFLLQRARCLLALGRRREVSSALQAVERCEGVDAAAWDEVGTLRNYAGNSFDALYAYDRAVVLDPQNPCFIYNRATVRRFIGDLDGAEADYDRVIAIKPLDYEAHLNRSELRLQTAARNHIAQLKALTEREIADWRGYVQVQFALAKEYEDIGEYQASFVHLTRGATMRREHMKYDVATDLLTVDWIIRAFPEGPCGIAPHTDKASPIFIVGLPRSGTTLVERILSSHPSLSSAGELDCFALALVDAIYKQTGAARIPRQELIARSTTLDFAALGREYLLRAHAAFDGSDRFIDKMPLNYLYCSLIRRALPNAKIIHVRRHPMAVCYAMYKTLFRDGYPFSYDLEEIAQYYVAYRRLMNHWESLMPDFIYKLSYEDLVADQRGETNKLLEFCGLKWDQACESFYQNPAATSTASASQVRRPIYKSSISQWRHHEVGLAILSRRLTDAGIIL